VIHDVSSKDAVLSSIFDLLLQILLKLGCAAISRRSARVSTEMSVSIVTVRTWPGYLLKSGNATMGKEPENQIAGVDGKFLAKRACDTPLKGSRRGPPGSERRR
jgi:hypothetical protein